MLSLPFKHSLPIKKKLALVAHDTQKDSMIRWCQKHLKQLKKHNLFATGTTGNLLEQRCGLKVKKFSSGALGGDQQMGASIVEKKVNMLIFFWDPLELMPHDPDIKALLRVATMSNISKTILLKVLSWEKDISFVNLYPKMYTN